MNRLTGNARQLARCILDSEWNQRRLSERLARLLEGGPPEPRQLAARLILQGGSERSPRFRDIVAILVADDGFRKHFSTGRRIRIQVGEPVMQPTPDGLVTLPLPQLPTRRRLAQWLGLSEPELDWFCTLDRRNDVAVDARLRHYRYELRERRHGYARLLEKPKPRLKSLQQQINANILNKIPVHDNAHGYRRHRSCRTAAQPHAGYEILLKMDLQDFFITITRARVEGLFRLIGYPEGVAISLSRLCTHRTALQACGDCLSALSGSTRQRLIDWHLPQGAPTSPALANLCAWQLDARLTGLSEKMGLRYTRYADDLAFSADGGILHRRAFIESLVGAISREEGFQINFRKTRWMHAAQRQHFCGITVNRHPNIRRRDYDRLKALLHNCIRFGPDSQNLTRHPDFKRHLEGRVSHVVYLNPRRGGKLQAMLQSIQWR